MRIEDKIMAYLGEAKIDKKLIAKVADNWMYRMTADYNEEKYDDDAYHMPDPVYNKLERALKNILTFLFKQNIPLDDESITGDVLHRGLLSWTKKGKQTTDIEKELGSWMKKRDFRETSVRNLMDVLKGLPL